MQHADIIITLFTIIYGLMLADVMGATVASAYLDDLTDAAGGMLTSVLGGVAGTVAGPVVNGTANALVTGGGGRVPDLERTGIDSDMILAQMIGSLGRVVIVRTDVHPTGTYGAERTGLVISRASQ